LRWRWDGKEGARNKRGAAASVDPHLLVAVSTRLVAAASFQAGETPRWVAKAARAHVAEKRRRRM